MGANKNPFLKSGKRKRRAKKNVVRKPTRNVFCPRLMIRYDQYEGSSNHYKTIWACKMCSTCVLSEHAVNDHLKRCKIEFKKINAPVCETVKPDEEIRHICRLCNHVFSRKVILMKHIENHEKPSDSDLYESDHEILVPRKTRSSTSKKPLKYRKQIASTSKSLTDHNQISSSSTTLPLKHIEENEEIIDLELCESNNEFLIPHDQSMPPSTSMDDFNQIESISKSPMDVPVNTLEVSEFNDNDENTVEN